MGLDGIAGVGGLVANRILVVEDDPEEAESLKSLLESHGYRVSVARDAGQAQSLFAMHNPEFVIVDLILPGESGFEICERIKKMEKSIPVLVYSVIEMGDSRRLAERVGADGYLTKPADPEELLASIERISQTALDEKRRGPAAELKEKRIFFSCECGKRFRVSPLHRGKSLTCPDCGEPVVVPRHD